MKNFAIIGVCLVLGFGAGVKWQSRNWVHPLVTAQAERERILDAVWDDKEIPPDIAEKITEITRSSTAAAGN